MKPFSTTASVVLALISVVQLLRVVLGWEVVVNGVSIPSWASAIAFVVAATLATMVWREAHR